NSHGVIEALQAPGQQQCYVGSKGRNQQREGDMAEPLQRIGTVQCCCFIVVIRDCLQTGNENQHTVTGIAPYSDHRNTCNNLIGLTQRAGNIKQDRVNIGIYITPDNGGAGQRSGKRNEHHCPAGICKFGVLEQQQGKNQTQQVCSKIINQGKLERVKK